MNKHVTYICLFLFVSTFANAQKQGQAKIDSISIELKNYKQKCADICLADSNKVILLNSLSQELKTLNPDTSLFLTNQALQIAEKIKWLIGIAQSNNFLASLLQARGNYIDAIEHANTAIAIWKKLLHANENSNRILEKLASTEGNLATIYLKTGEYAEALEYFLQINSIFEKLSLKSKSAMTIGNIAIVYFRLKDFNKSIEYSNRSLKLSEDANDEMGVYRACTNLGICYKELKQFNQALTNLYKALNIVKTNNDYLETARCMSNIASTYQEMNDDKKALEIAFEALKIDSEYNNVEGIAIRYVLIGNSLLELRRFSESEKYFLKALNIGDSIGNVDTRLLAIKNLRVVYEQQEKYKKALEYYQKEKIIEDSLFSQDKTAKITRLEEKYKYDKKESVAKTEQEKKDVAQNAEIEKQKLLRNSIAGGAGIILLSLLLSFFFYKRKRDAEQKQKETSLSLQVSETEMKALRSQMNPHFIFNALQSIQTFLLNNKSEDANTYLLKFSKLMRAVLENSQHSEVPLKEDMKALELYMQLESIRLPHPFTYQFHIDESVDVEETTIPPLILQPFVENSIWHGLQYKPESGHIDIFISKNDNALHATVEDNGVGRDMSKKAGHPMLLKKESLGMKLTEERLKILNEIKKIKAQFKITDLFTKENKPTGTRVELSLPLGS
ncbi:hypothetical protein BH11BAC1_BH11BAC1_04280 [soil metagenome]